MGLAPLHERQLLKSFQSVVYFPLEDKVLLVFLQANAM